MRYILFILLLLSSSILKAQDIDLRLDKKDWAEFKGKHFIVMYPRNDNDNMARDILQKAEGYYNSIADRTGYARYKDFWTWDERVKIICFANEEAFMKATGQPAWSKGFAVNHSDRYNLRVIVSYKGQEGFTQTILPHEIGHLILHDLMGADRQIPLWFDEGVAQLGEIRSDENTLIVAQLAAMGKTIPFTLLEGYRPAKETEQREVSIFYAESLYIVDFLIKTYGSDAFKELCRSLRDGKSFDGALKSAYYPTIDSMAGLEGKWLNYMKESVLGSH